MDFAAGAKGGGEGDGELAAEVVTDPQTLATAREVVHAETGLPPEGPRASGAPGETVPGFHAGPEGGE